MRRTSREAYKEIKENGLLSQRRWEVYRVLFKHGPLSQTETYNILTQNSKVGHQSYAPRFAELKRLGVIDDIGTRKCKITGRSVLIWDVTAHLPKLDPKPKKMKCKNCRGTGFIEDKQLSLF